VGHLRLHEPVSHHHQHHRRHTVDTWYDRRDRVLLAEAHEWAEALWVRDHRRQFKPVDVPNEQLPRVSVHVPAYNEPPEMMIETLNALPRSIIRISKSSLSTTTPKIRRCGSRCASIVPKLGPQFRFFHEDPLPGFKAGALNFALRQTDTNAEIIAVIDSDYIVHPRWLRDLVPQFANERIGIVQAPQDYSDARENAFKAMCYANTAASSTSAWSPARTQRHHPARHHDHRAQIALEGVNGWRNGASPKTQNWSAYLRNRVLKRPISRELRPRTDAGHLHRLQKAALSLGFGSVQILRKHAGNLLRRGTGKLTAGQRYHFVAGWLPWLADGINLLFNMAALCWSIAMLVAPTKIDPPLLVFSFCVGLVRLQDRQLVYLYQTRVGATTLQTISAAFAGLRSRNPLA